MYLEHVLERDILEKFQKWYDSHKKHNQLWLFHIIFAINTSWKTKQSNLIWGHTLVTFNPMETSSASTTSTITLVAGLSTQAIPATVVSAVLSISSYVTCYKNNSYLYLSLLLITISLLEHTEPISFLSKVFQATLLLRQQITIYLWK